MMKRKVFSMLNANNTIAFVHNKLTSVMVYQLVVCH